MIVRQNTAYHGSVPAVQSALKETLYDNRNRPDATGLRIVDARPEHAPFVAWVILTAFRSHLEKGFWDFIRPGTDEQLLRYLEALTTTETPHFTHLPLFIVAEVDGEPAAALSGYFDEEHGGTFMQGIAEADTKTGTSSDPEAIAPGLTILSVVPEHSPRTWIIESVATRPEFRRRGLVDALMQEIMDRGRGRGRGHIRHQRFYRQ